MAGIAILADRTRPPARHSSPQVGWFHPRVTVLAVGDEDSRQSRHARKFSQDATRIFHHPSERRVYRLYQRDGMLDEFLREFGVFGFRLVLSRAAAPVMSHTRHAERFARRTCPHEVIASEFFRSHRHYVPADGAAEVGIEVECDVFVAAFFDAVASLFAADSGIEIEDFETTSYNQSLQRITLALCKFGRSHRGEHRHLSHVYWPFGG